MYDRRPQQVRMVRERGRERVFEEGRRVDRLYGAINPSPDVNCHDQISHE